MSDSADKDSKTEEASEKKIGDALEKGQTPFSKELPAFASLLAILVFFVFFMSGNVFSLTEFMQSLIERPEEWSLATDQDAEALYRGVVMQIAAAVAAPLILLASFSLCASLLQNMPSMVLERIRPQWSRISLTKGLGRMFGMQGFVEFLKSLGKIFVAGAAVFFVTRETWRELLLGMITSPIAFVEVIRSNAISIIVAILLVMTLIAGADFFWSRFHWRAELRMTKQEVKDEHKLAEGDPIIKARLRSLARDRARNRMISAVPKATLIIANPTHFAIALRYKREENTAPMVVAKGQDLVALKIREIAEANDIPVFENVELARSMYKQVSIDKAIPTQFYHAVAELVRIVYAVKPQSVVR
ncbi:flagellar biosynthesis protein FlhB [Limoniibacter endophyticus]|uniref:Flagellar biosynthetic protein FlhB n=1 Tax=Limoniibacter endophyticus TaxID=1565040 RepID=A0A8J3GH67_9HYPH|nr:flagellar biosynthesis protein FlhB [Limoniibacter endophyticus]GHC64653.1 flagellar biosynthetic protein FlhB [Limoniibacter endophyticus]